MKLELINYGEAETSANNYIQVVKILLRLSGRKITDVYDHSIFEDIQNIIEEKHNSEAWCFECARFRKRVIRIFCKFAETGILDMSMAYTRIGPYPVNESHQRIIQHLLDSSNLSKSAYCDLKPVFKRFFNYLEENRIELDDVDDDLIFEYIAYVHDSGYQSMYRVNRVIAIIADYMEEKGIGNIKGNMHMLTARESPHRKIAPFEAEEIAKMIEAAERDPETPYRNKAILLLAYSTSLRGCDIRKLKLEDIDWINKTVSVRQSKTGKINNSPMNNATLNALADYILNERPETECREIFINQKGPKKAINGTVLHTMIVKYCNEMKIERDQKQSFHSIRRATASDLANEGVPLSIISEYLGHSDLSEARPYLSYTKQSYDCCIDFSDVPIKSQFYLNYKGDHSFNCAENYQPGFGFNSIVPPDWLIDELRGGEKHET